MKANITPDPPAQIGLDELASQCYEAGRKMSKRNENSELLLSAALALQTLGQQLEAAWAERDTLKDHLEAAIAQYRTDPESVIVLPGGHRVS